MSPAVLIDTDTLSEVLKQKNALVVAQAAAYLDEHGRFSFSALTRYEVLRGLTSKGAAVQIAQFEAFCARSEILAIDDAVLTRAARLWALARQMGQSRSDADLIIAATALVHGRPLVSGNTPHFAWIPDLMLLNWRVG
ncbi:tRNA(fMet)-specific endonuclease VapC [Caulifigura coniformis]|uniref:Ribonuclease VapC n=1 Tax=Caulifigura coniformis TaxID=2527983 RepID=A0A517S9L4_9PLAN|nr:type II toxin-antitoxin system VapC family toxin [Caulifigura coniformis]QDT52786.1 tRNA(fMet)-specific endonuclease VapC [Caulifigura coniformis]